MNESVYARINRVLSWKKIVGFNLVIFLALMVPLSVKLSQERADTRSSAANNTIPSPTPVPNYPNQPPKIERVSLFYGKPGDTVVIWGKNFGDYKWEKSKIYVGNREVGDKQVVRWSDKVIEAEIPEDAQTGKVWVRINNKQASWQGTLLVYDRFSAEVGLEKAGENEAVLWIKKGERVRGGKIELGYGLGEVVVKPYPGVKIEVEKEREDSLGRIKEIGFSLDRGLPSGKVPLLRLQKVGVGKVELVSVLAKDRKGQIITVFADPLQVGVEF